MLVELVVENYAIIERVRVRFHPGLNLLTGETGSGKSIVVDALALLFGGRASGEMVRSGAGRARISGIFELSEDPEPKRILEMAGIEPENSELLVEREIFPEGKSRAFIGSRPVTASLLRELAPYLGDIHGQHEQQRLFSADAQLEMLDVFAGAAPELASAASLFSCWRATARELEELERGEQEKLRMLDLWRFQNREIEDAALKTGEDVALEHERRVLQNVSRLQENAASAYTALYDSPESALSGIGQALRRLDELCRIDAGLTPVRECLNPARVAVEEAAFALRDYLSRLEADPGRLEEIETRLALLDKLKRKYGPALDDVIAFGNHVREQIAAMESAGERKAALEKERDRHAEEYLGIAQKLSAIRAEAAAELARRVVNELAALAMERTVFEARLEEAPWSERGKDSVRFLISANPGEEPRPLEKVASGGEISRIALALKTCIGAIRGTSGGARRTLVFDEVDAGIGGRAADAVGRRLKALAASNQVLCVTHLPQIAGFGDHHFLVEKKEIEGRTAAGVEELDREARKREIGRMLSGDRLTREALKQAEQLLKPGAGL